MLRGRFVKLCDLLRPAMRVCPRQSITALGYLGAGWGNDPEWKSVWPRYRSYFDRQLQCIVTADLADWSGRSCYYWGRFFDVTHQAVLRKFLAPGDTYIDIGANVGYQSLYAARLVGPTGSVLSFEPNPESYSVLAGHVAINRIAHCQTFQLALSDRGGEATLTQIDGHTGTANLRPEHRPALRSLTVPVRTGDEVLRSIAFRGKAFVKIDVEGFEQRVLAGLRDTLPSVTAVAVEITPSWLRQVGGSAEQLYAYMSQAGFRSFIPKLRWRMGLFGAQLELSESRGTIPEQHDAIFVR